MPPWKQRYEDKCPFCGAMIIRSHMIRHVNKDCSKSPHVKRGK